jgi:hypothetical protein
VTVTCHYTHAYRPHNDLGRYPKREQRSADLFSKYLVFRFDACFCRFEILESWCKEVGPGLG